MLCVDDLKSSAFTAAFCSAYSAQIAINKAVYDVEGDRGKQVNFIMFTQTVQ